MPDRVHMCSLCSYDCVHIHQNDHGDGHGDVSEPGCGEYKFSIRTNIRIYLHPKNDTNEYPNIFV